MTTTTQAPARDLSDGQVSTDLGEAKWNRSTLAVAIPPQLRKADIRFVSIEPGRISLHGIVLTDAEYAVLRGIAERMKRAATFDTAAAELLDLVTEEKTC